VYLASLKSANSRRTMRQALTAIAALASGSRADIESFPWHLLRYQHTAAIRAQLGERYAAPTANKLLSALRRTIREAERLGLLPVDDARRAGDIPNYTFHRELRGRALSGGELAALFAACAADETPAGARDAALLAIGYGAGLRRSELAALDLANYDPATGTLVIRGGKGDKDRTTYLDAGAAAAVASWLQLRGARAGRLFLPVDKRGQIQHTAHGITGQAVMLAYQKRGAAALVRAFSPHDLRRTFISDMLDAGADIATVQRMVGHADVNTTAKYDRRGEDAKRSAAQLIRVPYQVPGARTRRRRAD
jgi:site-specific recombinase XerD